MRAADLVTAAVLLALGGIVLADAVRLGSGWGSDGPRSGFFPFWLALTLIGVAAVIGGRAWRRRDGRPFATRAQMVPVLWVLLPAAALVVAMQGVGLYVASALYIAFYMRAVGRHSWPAVVGCAGGIVGVTFLVFERWFLVPLPKGPLEAWLGF